jgi:general transcription factor 3C polypeptide 5 (transcription factor C subunit 1)
MFTNISLPFNYAYSQNPYVHNVGGDETVNITLPNLISTLISADDPAPTAPRAEPDMMNVRTVEIIAELEEAFDERPIWTRRALLNRIGRVLPTWNEARKYTSYVSYQFKGGPWRDAMVKYGIDPRTSPEYRKYQTLMFQIGRDYRKAPREGSWREVRKGRDAVPREFDEEMTNSHIFDGQEYYTDGKVWQVCDITDPLLAKLFTNADVRPEMSPVTGWYHGGLWAKAKAIMKTKLLAIMFGREVRDIDFARSLTTGNMTPPKGAMLLQIPNLRLTDEEWFGMTGKKGSARRRHRIDAAQRSAPTGPSRKTLEYFAAGGALPTDVNHRGEQVLGIEKNSDDDETAFEGAADVFDHFNIDPSLSMDIEGGEDAEGDYYGGYEQVEEAVNEEYDEGEEDEDEEEESDGDGYGHDGDAMGAPAGGFGEEEEEGEDDDDEDAAFYRSR